MAELDSDPEAGIFGQYPAGKFRAGASAVSFPVLAISEQGGNRIVPQARVNRPGAKLDSTGTKPRSFTVQTVFNNSIAEPDVSSNLPMYPRVLLLLLRLFQSQETGTLTLPTVGEVRCRLQDYTRDERFEERDTARVTLVFVEDNEDSLSRAALAPPSVTATVVRLAEQTQFSAQKDGIWDPSLGTLRERMNELETLMRAPGRSVADVSTIVRAHRRAIESLVATAREESGATGIFGEPRASHTERQLVTLSDREAQAETERTASRPRTKAYVVDVERTSLYEIAARLRQDVTELMDLNAARVADPFDLTRGEVIRVYETAA